MNPSGSTYVRFRGRVSGPFPPEQLARMIQRGQVTRLHEVSWDKLSWRRAGEDHSLFPPRPSSADTSAGEYDAIIDESEASAAVATPTRTEPDGDAIWRYEVDGEQRGPISVESLARLVASGQIGRDTLVWRPGMPDWTPLGHSALLKQQLGGMLKRPAAIDPASLPDADFDVLAEARHAGFWLRFCALVLDGIFLALLQAVALGIGYALMRSYDEQTLTRSLSILSNVSGWLFAWAYYTLLESSGAQATLGKRMLGLYVTDSDGQPISFLRANGRFFAKRVSDLTLLIGYLMAGFTDRKRALHDMIAGTLVMRR